MKSIVTTIVGIAAALAVMALGIFIPKALLAQEESKYFSEEQKRETTAAPTMMPQPLPTTEPITSPLPGAGHALDLGWLYNAKSLIENETYLKLREPLPFEMSMETAAFMAQNELELLSSLGALQGCDTTELRFKSGELRGYTDYVLSFYTGGSMSSAPGRPVGFWRITFLNGDGKPIIVECDSQRGLVYSVDFSLFKAPSDFICCSMLISYAKYLGFPPQGIRLDSYDELYVLEVNGLRLTFSFAEKAHNASVHIIQPDDYKVYGRPTPLPEQLSIPAPTLTPTPAQFPATTPAPTPTPPPIPAQTASSPVSTGAAG